jgi:hypothetical protein
MNYLYAALDESEDGYYAMVVGDTIAIERQARRIPPTFVHMASWHGNDDEKRQIVRNLDFDGNIEVHCAKFGLKVLQNKIHHAIVTGRCRMPSIKINNTIGYEMARAIDKFYYKFALDNHFQVTSLTFVVDNVEMINYLKNGHNAVKKFGKVIDAHTIADCIAYANFRKWNVSSKVIEHRDNFEETFHASVLDIINKK